jgi:hypothetical protein
VFNILLVVGLALSGWAMCLVMTRWTGSQTAGVIAGLLYGFNAHVLTRFPDLQAQHVEFFPIALLAIDRVLDRAARGDKWLLSGAFVLQSLCSNYLLVFTAFSLAAAVAVRPEDWLPRARWSVSISLVTAAAVSIVAVAPFLWPYYQVSRDQGMARTLDEVAQYSAHWQNYLATGGRLHYNLWSRAFVDGRTALFPGLTGLVLAAVSVATGLAWRDRRARTAAAVGLVGFALSFGPALPGYAWLHTHTLVGGLRNAVRWGWLFLASVAMLAGFGWSWLERAWQISCPARPGLWRAMAVLVSAAVTVEALRAPVGLTRFQGIPHIYDRAADEPHAVLVEFPIYYGPGVFRNAPYLVNNTRSFQPLVNGYSGFETRAFQDRARLLQRFPDALAIGELRALGVTLITVHASAFASGDARRLDALDHVSDLQLLADENGIRLYRLR